MQLNVKDVQYAERKKETDRLKKERKAAEKTKKAKAAKGAKKNKKTVDESNTEDGKTTTAGSEVT